MVKVQVITKNIDKINDQVKESATRVEKYLARVAKRDTEPYTPALTGEFSANTRVEGNEIIYPAPMARYLYYGKLMVDPYTGSAWAQKGVKKVLTDKNLVFSKTVHPQAQSHWFEASKAQNMAKWKRDAERLLWLGL